MKKKLISVMLCAAMATTMFSSVAVHAEGDDEGEIYMFISQPEYADAITTLIDEYKNVEPGVTINYETTQNDYPTLLKAKLNSGVCPDIFSSTSGKEIETYKEYSLDLTGQPLVDAMDDNVAAAMKDANGEGCYGVAIKGNYFGLIYNQDLLDKAGVEKVPETMTELKDCVEKLKAADITPFTDAASDDVQKLIAGFEDGSDSLNNYPVLTDNFFDFVDLVKDNGDQKPLETDLSGEEAAFASGKAAIMVGQGAWVEGDLMKINPDLKITFSGYPVDEDASHCQVITGSDQALRVNKDSENKDIVLNFLNWWYTSDYGQSWFTDVAGVVPPIKGDFDTEYEVIKQGSASVEEKGAAPLAVIYSTDSLHQAFGEAMQAYVEGSASKEDTISTIEQKYQEIDGASN